MKKIKKIGIIGVRGLPAQYGAFDTFLDQYVRSIEVNNKNLEIYVSCENKFNDLKYNSPIIKRIFLYRGSGILILINYFLSILIMLKHGVKTFMFFGYGASIYFPLLKILKCKIVCNPDGIEWRRPESYFKKIYFKLCEILFSKVNIYRIFDSKVIEKYYNIKYKAKGITLYYPSIFEKLKKIKKKNKKFDRFYIIGRLLEENNTKLIVKAFCNTNSNQKLYIIGKSNKYFERNVMPIIKKSKNIFYIGPIYNKDKLLKICSLADYYIHGHSVGGTNPTLIEAVSLKKPIIAFKTSFNKEILNNNAIYFKNEKELSSILNSKIYIGLKNPEFKYSYTSEYINNGYSRLILD